MIQVIQYKDYPKIKSSKDIIITNFSNYKSFDLYDTNIICLNDTDMWHYNGANNETISSGSDICKLKKSINTSKSKILIIMPKNCCFRFEYSSYNNKYNRSVNLKNMLTKVKNIISTNVFEDIIFFEYEPGIANINGYTYDYDFYFEYSKDDSLIRGEKNNKTVAYRSDNVVLTTLQLTFRDDIEEVLYNLLNTLFMHDKEPVPDWIEDINFYNDTEYKESNEKIECKIEELNNKIVENNSHLSINNHFKSILYETGENLQKVIIEIIENILQEHFEYDDVYEEDYLFKSNNYSFIVETKGINGEVQGKNVTDAFSHMTIYEDNLEQKGISENVKCLFFVASERNKNPDIRKKVNSRNITIAKRNNTLIINTPVFLQIYEDFLNNKITKEEIINLFIEQDGLIEYESR